MLIRNLRILFMERNFIAENQFSLKDIALVSLESISLVIFFHLRSLPVSISSISSQETTHDQ